MNLDRQEGGPGRPVTLVSPPHGLPSPLLKARFGRSPGLPWTLRHPPLPTEWGRLGLGTLTPPPGAQKEGATAWASVWELLVASPSSTSLGSPVPAFTPGQPLKMYVCVWGGLGAD